MIQISDYDVILTHSPIYEITGHIFECFDYYLFLKQYYNVGILFFDGLSEEKLKIAFNSKYNIDFDDIKKDIIFIKLDPNNNTYTTIKFNNKTVVILTDGHIKSLNHRKIIFATNKLYGFMCEYDEFEKQKFNKHITYLQDYRIYNKNMFFNSIDYVKKLPFKFYKKINRIYDNIGMMYTTFVCRKITPYVVQQYHEMSGCKKTLLIVPYKLNEYDNIDGVEQIQAPVENLMEKFDTYIYTPVERKFDCSPRLVTECFLYKKNVLININYTDIGLKTRYNDCKNIELLNLTDNDKILDVIKNA